MNYWLVAIAWIPGLLACYLAGKASAALDITNQLDARIKTLSRRIEKLEAKR